MTEEVVTNASLPPAGNTRETEPENHKFYPALDGLRAIAFLMVFFDHYGRLAAQWSVFDWTWTGLDIFFVLSGFLITGILLDTIDRPNFFRTFYIRRTLRIFPLYYGFWIALIILTPVLHCAWNRYNVTWFAYIGNFFIARAPLHPDTHPSVVLIHTHWPVISKLRGFNVGPLWSLCVEEQFYLLWPMVIWLVRSRPKLLRVCLCLIVLVPIVRAIYLFIEPQSVAQQIVYTYSWTRVDTLLFGAVLAIWIRKADLSTDFIRRVAWAAFLIAPTLLYAGSLMFGSKEHPELQPFVGTVGYTLAAAASSALIVLALNSKTVIYRVLKLKVLREVGRITYGMYFFHDLYAIPVRELAAKHSPSYDWVLILVVLVVTYVIAWLSFHLYESRFLRLKSRLAPAEGR